MPFNVRADTGWSFVDQNSLRMPSMPLYPLIKSVTADVDWPSIDIVTDRNNLRKLLRFIEGRADKDFRIDLQLAGKKTVLMTRWEKRNREMMSGKTFGFGFEKAQTVPVAGCEESTGHHRVVNYVGFFPFWLMGEADVWLRRTSRG